MVDPYSGREQTQAKHFILRNYLQALAFKVLRFSDITYIDGFSGPWETKTENFSDSSFMIAISVLQDAQKIIHEQTGIKRRIRCFFSENNADAYAKLKEAVAPFHNPIERFEIRTYGGKFEDAVVDIQKFSVSSFPLIFIDPTGWSGYPFDKIKPLFIGTKCEVLINFMYDYINRFSSSEDKDIVASLSPILGGDSWRDRLDKNLPRGFAVEKLFRETLKSSGNFAFVVSTKIDKATAERPHFFIAYATKSLDGLKAFRKTEYDALRKHVQNRSLAKERVREKKTSTPDLFSGYDAKIQETSIEDIILEQKDLAKHELLRILETLGSLSFMNVISKLLQEYMLRETNIKDICVELAKIGKIENTWGGGNRKPSDGDIIRAKTR